MILSNNNSLCDSIRYQPFDQIYDTSLCDPISIQLRNHLYEYLRDLLRNQLWIGVWSQSDASASVLRHQLWIGARSQSDASTSTSS